MHLGRALSSQLAHSIEYTQRAVYFGAIPWVLLYFALASLAHTQEAASDAAELEKIRAFHAELGIPSDYAAQTGLPLQLSPGQLKDVGKDMFGRPQRLDSQTADAWAAMVAAASGDGVSLLLVSAFRPPEYQRDLLRRKLRAGETIGQALEAVAAPGHSEHQSGRAVDIACHACPVVETQFEDTEAFAWLTDNAADYGFFLSYPRDNPHGVMYEPWHWCYKGN